MITTEGRAESLRLIQASISEFRVSNTTNPANEAATDGGGAADGMTPVGYTSILTFPLIISDSSIDLSTETLTVLCKLSPTQGNGQVWTEVGLYFSSGDLLTREVVVNPVLKDASNEMVFKINITL